MSKGDRPLVPSVRAAMRILKHLRKHSNQSLTEISRALALNKSTCLNILKELQAHNVVTFDESSKRYSLGYALIGLGTAAAQSFRWFDLTRPLLHELHRSTGMATMAAQRVGDHLVVVDGVEPTNRVHVSVPRGVPLHIASGALGKCYLAFVDPQERHALIGRLGLPRFSPNTITELSDFERELATVREQGYAESYGEFAEGINAVAAPVFDATGTLLIILGVAGLSTAMPPRQMRLFGEQLRVAGRRLSAVIGGHEEAANGGEAPVVTISMSSR